MAPNNSKKAVAECISDDALIHLRSYKYSSVDLSPTSKYILGPWVRTLPNNLA
jgi:ethanolaminephosphotransferase